jgi:hypothetical protein
MDVILAADEIAQAHIAGWGDELREQVVNEMIDRPQWMEGLGRNPTPAALAERYVSVASTLRAAEVAEVAKEQARLNKEQAQTLTGGSSRPASLTPDQAYWERVKSVNTGRYADS